MTSKKGKHLKEFIEYTRLKSKDRLEKFNKETNSTPSERLKRALKDSFGDKENEEL